MNIYEITEQMIAVQAVIDALESTPDQEAGGILAEALNSQEGLLEDKLEACARIIRNSEARDKALSDEEKRLKDERRIEENKQARLKDGIKYCLTLLGRDKATAAHFKFSVCKNGGKAPLIVDIEDPCDLPKEFQKVTVDMDRDRIREALSEGVELPFARIGEPGTHLRIS